MRTLLATGLLLGVAATHAATSTAVTRELAARVQPGMTQSEVRQALGAPMRHRQSRGEPGPTFSYRIATKAPLLFDVDFGADGKVASVGERMDAPICDDEVPARKR